MPFLLIRYVTYIVAFLKISMLASELGPHTYGVWGFIKLIWQYLSFLTLGIHFSINVLIASNKEDYEKIIKLSRVSLSLTFAMFFVLLIGAILMVLLNITPFEKYEIGSLIIATVAIGMLKNINLTNINIARNFDKLYSIGIYYLVSEVIIILIIELVNQQYLLNYVIYATLVIELTYTLIFIFKHKFKFEISFDKEAVKELVLRGVKLLMYNYSLIFMFLSVRTVVAFYYGVNDFGEYTFANSLVDSLFVAFSSVLWIFFPKMITKLSTTSDDESIKIIDQLRVIYIPLMFLSLLMLGYASFIMKYVFPEYKLFKEIFIIMLLSLGLRDYAFGFNTVIIARGKEILLAKYAVIAIVLNVAFSIYLGENEASLVYIPMVTLVASFLYSLAAIFASRKIIGEHNQLMQFFKDWKIFLPLLSLMLFYLFNSFTIYSYSFAVVLYMVLNVRSIYSALQNTFNVFTIGKI